MKSFITVPGEYTTSNNSYIKTSVNESGNFLHKKTRNLIKKKNVNVNAYRLYNCRRPFELNVYSPGTVINDFMFRMVAIQCAYVIVNLVNKTYY
jgi:hypothetical protein